MREELRLSPWVRQGRSADFEEENAGFAMRVSNRKKGDLV